MTETETVSLDDVTVELPPAMEQFLSNMRGDRKKLMRTPAFGESPAQLREFLGMYTYPRQMEMFEMLASSVVDTYQLAVSNAAQMQRLHAFVVDELNDLGADLDDVELPGVSPEVMDDFQQAFFAVGSLLKEKLPDDKEMEDVWNRCAALFGVMTHQLMGLSVDDEDREDDREDREDDDAGRRQVNHTGALEGDVPEDAGATKTEEQEPADA